MMEILNGISHEDNFESDCYWKDATQLIRKTLNRSPKLSEYFEASLKLCAEGEDYSDAEIARYMGRTRACIGQYRKALLRIMQENGLLAEFTQLMAA